MRCELRKKQRAKKLYCPWSAENYFMPQARRVIEVPRFKGLWELEVEVPLPPQEELALLFAAQS